jgi:hypothetical protein
MTSPNPAQIYARTQLRFDAQLSRILERTAQDIRARIGRLPLGVGGVVRKAQLELVLSEIRTIQGVMWNDRIMSMVTTGKGIAAEMAESATEALEAVLYASLPESVADVVRGGLRATALSGIERDVARVPRALSARVYQDFALTSGQVEATIRAGIISGLSARELAQSVYKYISPTTPGGASYAASRLARTEINNSFHEQQIKGGQRPGVLGVVWNLSGSHGKPDECNLFASQDVDNLGRGVYKPNNVPGKPHPQCLCNLTYKTMDPADFEKALKAGKFDDDLDARIQQNLRRVANGETPIPSAPKSTSRIDHSTHDHPNTTQARTACRKRLQALSNEEAKLPADVPKVFHQPEVPKVKDPHPELSKMPRTQASKFGGVEDADAVVAKANGGYSRFINGGTDYGANCQQVVQAAELRKRGFDVMARARRKDYSNFVVQDGWRYPRNLWDKYGIKPQVNFGMSFARLKTILDGYAEGERAWVMCRWKSGGAHIFNVGVEDGKVIWYDAQPARVVSRGHRDGISQTNARVAKNGWGIIQHTELLEVDDDVLINVEQWR